MINDILKKLRIKCSLGYGVERDHYYIIAYTIKQAEQWEEKLRKAGYRVAHDYHMAYRVLFSPVSHTSKTYKHVSTGEIATELELCEMIDRHHKAVVEDDSAVKSWVEKHVSPYDVMKWYTELLDLGIVKDTGSRIKNKLLALYLDSVWPKEYKRLMADWKEIK